MPKVIVLSDEAELAEGMYVALSEAGHEVICTADSEHALSLAERRWPHLGIVDLDLAEMETCNLAAELLRYSEVLTILMSARHDEPHVVRALQSGGDMFVAKPFSMRELVVRVDSLLRRLSDDMPLGSDALILDPARHAVIKHGQEIRLSPKEFQLIACLMRWEGQVVPHDVLLREVWGPEYEGERGLLALYIYYLRQKIEDDPAHPVYIHTRTRIGYCFSRLAQSFCLCPTEAPIDTDS